MTIEYYQGLYNLKKFIAFFLLLLNCKNYKFIKDYYFVKDYFKKPLLNSCLLFFNIIKNK
jgi:hypothetical protein